MTWSPTRRGATKRLSLTMTLGRAGTPAVDRPRRRGHVAGPGSPEPDQPRAPSTVRWTSTWSSARSSTRCPSAAPGCTSRATISATPVVYVRLPELTGRAGDHQLQQRRVRRHRAEVAGRRDHHHRRRRGLHPRLSRTCNADLITPPAGPPRRVRRASPTAPMVTVRISGLLKAVVAHPGRVAGFDEFGHRAARRPDARGPVVSRSMLRSRPVSSCSEFASHMARTRSGAVAATRVPSRNDPAASARRQRDLARRRGERLGEQVREVRDGRGRRRRARRNGQARRTAPQSSARCITVRPRPPGSTWSSTLITHGRAGEQSARRPRPSPSAPCRPSDARRRIGRRRPCSSDCCQYCAFDAGDVGECALGRWSADAVEHDRQRGHGDGSSTISASVCGARQ